MPSRLIRDDLLDSERVHTIPVEARWLYVSILLSADDIGIFQAAPFRLARRAGVEFSVTPALLQMLVDVDLVRLYRVDGKEFGFIPRFRQRLQLRRIKHPLPPEALMQDEKDAINKINNLGTKSTVNNGEPRKSTENHGKSPPEAEAEAEEKKKRHTSAAPPPYDMIVQAYHDALPTLPRVRLQTARRQRAMREFWAWVMASKKSDGTKRAETTEDAVLWIASYFSRAGQNDFLMGRRPSRGEHANWVCDFDFLLTERGRCHVIEKTQEQA